MSETKPPFHLEIIWDNNPEALADDLFAKMGRQKADSPAEAFRRRFCIVTPTRIQQAWLQQRFLYDLPRPITPHVLFAEFTKAGLIRDSWNEKEGN